MRDLIFSRLASSFLLMYANMPSAFYVNALKATDIAEQYLD